MAGVVHGFMALGEAAFMGPGSQTLVCGHDLFSVTGQIFHTNVIN